MFLAECSFLVDAVPVPQPRQRFAGRYSASAGRVIPVAYHDSANPVHTFKQAVALAGRLARSPRWPMGEKVAYRLLLVFVMPEVSNLPKRRVGRLPNNRKPDLDNLIKGVKDALKGITWDDDGRVFECNATKVYPAPGESPGVRVVIQAVDDRTNLAAVGYGAAADEWRAQAQHIEGR